MNTSSPLYRKGHALLEDRKALAKRLRDLQGTAKHQEAKALASWQGRTSIEGSTPGDGFSRFTCAPAKVAREDLPPLDPRGMTSDERRRAKRASAQAAAFAASSAE